MDFSQPVTSVTLVPKLEPSNKLNIKRIEKEAKALSLPLCWLTLPVIYVWFIWEIICSFTICFGLFCGLLLFIDKGNWSESMLLGTECADECLFGSELGDFGFCLKDGRCEGDGRNICVVDRISREDMYARQLYQLLPDWCLAGSNSQLTSITCVTHDPKNTITP